MAGMAGMGKKSSVSTSQRRKPAEYHVAPNGRNDNTGTLATVFDSREGIG